MPKDNSTTQGIVTPLDAAIKYAGHYGWPVFPCLLVRRPDGKLEKKPLVKWGTEDAAAINARDPEQIERWWRRWPDAVPGMPTGERSGMILLDIDVKDGRNGFDTLDDLGKPILPDTPMSHTPSGGLHLFFARTGLEIRNSAGDKGLGVGLDVRGDGGYVVLPAPNSGYWWDPIWNFDTAEPLPAPAWLGHREKPEPRRSAGGHLDPITILRTACDNIRTAAPGERHDVLNREVFWIAQLVATGALDKARAQHELATAATGMLFRTRGDRAKAERDFADAFSDGLAAPRRARR